MKNLIREKTFLSKSWWILSLVLLVIVSCKGGADGKFSALDSPDATVTAAPPVTVKITSWQPSNNLISLPSKGQTTFGVTLENTDANVKYEYKLDSATVLQDGTNAFYNLNSNIITPGTHTITVRAYNSISEDSHTFNLTINSPTEITTFVPVLTGTTIACNVDNLTLSALYTDANPADTITAKWFVNDTQVTIGNTQAAVINDPTNFTATMTYHPNCSRPGVNFIRLELNDGQETTAQTWTVFVASSVVIHIADAIPVADPVVFTNSSSTTFALTLATPDPTAKYNFVMDNTVSMQNDYRAYLNILGSNLTTGVHTLKVTASNSSSAETKTFNIKKNGPPVLATNTPALTGVTISCGTTPLTLVGNFTDPNNDTLSYTWTVDDHPSAQLVPNNSGNRAEAAFSPTCASAGTRTIKVVAYDGYESTTTTWSVNVVVPLVIHINSFYPTPATNVLASRGITTFGVTLDATDPTVKYEYKLDSNTILQDSTASSYNLDAATLTPGAHTLVVKAYSAISSDSHTFNIVVNSPTVVNSFVPALTGTTLSCGQNSVTMSALYSDVNTSDVISAKWYLNDTLVTLGNSQVSVTNDPGNNLANANYHPNCTHPGINFVRLDLNDGKEITTKTWTIFVNSQIIISIADAIPLTNPTVFTNLTSATFAVTLATPDPLATYNFVLDNTTSLQNDHHSYLSIIGSNLSPGNHTLKVTAANASSSDSKIFNIRKNSVPALGTFSPTLTGTAVSCSNTPITIYGNYTDADSDVLTYTWTLDDSPSSQLVANNSANRAQVSFTPSCSNPGTKIVKVIVSDGYETTSTNWSINVVVPLMVHINSFSPTASPINIASTGTTTFGVTLDATDATVKYEYKLDSSTIVQDTTNPVYNLNSQGLSAGAHTLTVRAYNSISSDSHSFNLMVNSPTMINSFIPTLTGTTLKCGIDSVSMSALYSDMNSGDTINAKWYLNGTLVSLGNTQVSTSNDPSNNIASSNYHPDCSTPGINFIRLDLNDGKEITSQTWTIYVESPIVIHISDSIPTTNPTVFTSTSSTTFAVTLTTPDPTANYSFVLDNTTTLQNDRRTYITLSGSSLSAGPHTLKVTATNANSTDSKTFNIKKNSAPVITAFSPAYSGTTLSCGGAAQTLYADFTDGDSDPMTYTWTVDDAPSSFITPGNSAGRAQAIFNPSCSIAGTRTIKAVASDGYETRTATWTISVVSPITIAITSFLPTTNPIIITSAETKTFAVALSTSDQNVTYNFKLKNLATSVITTLQSGTVPFYNLVGNNVAAGLYELDVIASNGSSSDHHVFSVRKNSPPALPPSPLGTFTPAATGSVINCGSGSQLFRSDLSDADNDIVAVNWFLDGSAAPANLVSNSTQTEAKATYTPTCSEVGVKNIRVTVFDGYETTTRTWTVSIVNPTIASITTYSPNTDPVRVLSTGTQTFTISATGKAPLSYEWKLDGNVISAATGAFTTITAASLNVGAHTLVAKVSDSDSNQSHTFNIIRNAPPALANKLPASSAIKININTITNFSASYSDANNDSMTVQWKLNNIVVGSGNPNARVTNSSNSTLLTLSPSAAIIGDNTVELTINDGYEPTTVVWNVNINYFSDVCNNMGAGRACTIIGRPGMGSGINPQTNPEATRVQPMYLVSDENSNYFFSDPNTHTVWFYNKSAATVNILGQSIAAGKLQIVAGIGMTGTGITGISYNDFPLNTPRGVAWDNTNKRLFISNEGTNQVLMVDSDGIVSIIAGGGGNNTAGNSNGTLATASYCQAPRGLYYHQTQKALYVACSSSGTIKVVDTTSSTVSSWTMNIVSGRASGGATSNTYADGTNGVAGTAQIYSPNHLKYDVSNDILYVTQSSDCRVRAINMTATNRNNYYFGAVSLPASSTNTVIGAGCTTFTTGGYAAARYNGGWMGIELYMSGSTLNGLFVTDYNTSRVTFVNNTTNSITLGGAATPSYSMNTIWGSGTNGYYMPCTSASATTCYTYSPSTMMIQGTRLYLADYNNYRIRYLSLATPDGAVTDDIGFDSKKGFAGNGGTSSEYVQFNTPLNLYYNDNTDKLIISDFNNYRIRSLNMITGRIDSFIGNGAGDANTSNADPSVLGLRGPRAVVNYQNKMVYADNQNNNCVIRALNTDSSNQNILGVLTNANAVQTIAGNWAQGCGAWNPAATTGTASTARLNNPQGVTTDGTNLYFANTNSHCIIKVDSSGNMSTLAGLCGTSGGANGAGTAFTNSTIRFLYPTAVVADPRAPYTTAGNLFILDQTTAGPSKVRYLNQGTTAVTIYGININPGEIRTIYTAADNHGADLAAFDSQICFSSGGNFNYNSNGNSSNSNNNIICFNRDESTGTTFYRFGRNPSSYIGRGAQPYNLEEEGVAATSISLAGPAGLTFDEYGNLFVAERDAHSIRMIKRWW